MQNTDPQRQSHTLLIFVLAISALLVLIFATQVDLPLRAILIAVAVSDIIFLLLLTIGKKIAGRRE